MREKPTRRGGLHTESGKPFGDLDLPNLPFRRQLPAPQPPAKAVSPGVASQFMPRAMEADCLAALPAGFAAGQAAAPLWFEVASAKAAKPLAPG